GKHHSILFGFVTGDLYIENAQTGWLPRDREPAAFAGWLVSYLLPSSVVTVPDYTASYVERIHVGRMACGALGTAVHPLNHSAYDPYVQIELQFGRVGEHQLGGLRLSAGLRYYLLEQVYIKAEYFKAGTILSIKNRTGFGFIGAGQNHERHSYQEQGYRFGAGVAFEWGTPEPPAGEPDSYRPTTPEADDRPSDSQNNGDKRDFEPSPPDQEQMPPSDEAIQL
ncbi:MAG: hypothetical protein K1X75_18095, partial [Leptospirales bacterium]|nr:hypothetical protein [Leptospirales bacterium]